MIEHADGIRRRRVMAGEGMVTPTRPLTIEEDGKVETLIPGRSRITIDHQFVREHPEQFDPCWDHDRVVRARLIDYLEGAIRDTPARTTTSVDVNYGLGPAGRPRPSWEL